MKPTLLFLLLLPAAACIEAPATFAASDGAGDVSASPDASPADGSQTGNNTEVRVDRDAAASDAMGDDLGSDAPDSTSDADTTTTTDTSVDAPADADRDASSDATTDASDDATTDAADADVSPPPPARVALVVADADGGLSQLVADHMTANGLDVTVISEELAPPADLDLIVVSQTATGGGSFSSNLTLAWGPLDVPMIIMKAHATDELGTSFSYLDRHAVANRTTLQILDATHAIADGVPSPATLFTQPATNYCFSTLSVEAQIVANTDASDLAIACTGSIWVLPAGATLQDGTTRTTPRVALLLGDGGVYDLWTADAWRLFDNTVAWLLP